MLRTEGGSWYEEFTNDEFIAIGWNKLDKKYCQNVHKESALRILDKYYPENKQQTLIINNIDKFYNKMKIGDIVVLPSEGSQVLMFCEIIGNVYNQKLHKQKLMKETVLILNDVKLKLLNL